MKFTKGNCGCDVAREKTLHGRQRERNIERDRYREIDMQIERETECVFCVDKCILQNATGHNKGCLLRHMIETLQRGDGQGRAERERQTENGQAEKITNTHTHRERHTLITQIL